VCEDGLFIPGFVVHHAHGEKMERVKLIYVLDGVRNINDDDDDDDVRCPFLMNYC
jgi:hypothetical protein